MIQCFLILQLLLYSVCAVQVTWCTYRTAEFQKCLELSYDYQAAGSQLTISCEESTSEDMCVSYIAGSSDPYYIRTVNAGMMYQAYRRDYNIKPILVEEHGDTAGLVKGSYVNYYSVAVVKSGNRKLRLYDLKDKRACHVGYDPRSSNGWDLPMGYFAAIDDLHFNDRCNAIDAVTKYFGPSCLSDNSGSVTDRLRTCSLCYSNTCSQETRYAGYDGAFRCLTEGGGDVAFLKHSTVGENTGGANPASWAKNLQSSDYRLLCKDGTQVTVDGYQSCNIALVKGDALAVHGDMSASDVSVIQRELRNPPPTAAKYMFESSRFSASRDILFSDATTELIYLTGDRQQTDKFLGQPYTWYMNSINCLENSSYTMQYSSLNVLVSVLLTLCIRMS